MSCGDVILVILVMLFVAIVGDVSDVIRSPKKVPKTRVAKEGEIGICDERKPPPPTPRWGRPGHKKNA